MSVRRCLLRGPRVVFLSMMCVACGDDAPQRSESLNTEDGGRPGAPDAAISDASMLDAEVGEPPSDAGWSSECRGDLFSFPSVSGRGPSFASAILGNQLELAYLEAACGGDRSSSSAQGIAHVMTATVGEPSPVEALANLEIESCYVTRYPALVTKPGGGFGLFFSSNRGGSNDLFYFDSSTKEPVRRTQDVMRDESAIAAAWIGDAPLVVYARENYDGPAVTDLVSARTTGAPELLAVEAEGFHATQVAVSALSSEQSATYAGAVAWVSDHRDRPGVFLRFIDGQGRGAGPITALSNGIGPRTNVALAAREDGGAVVYTVEAGATAIRFRTLDGEGNVGPEVELTSGNQSVRDVALAAYSNGYVVAYRRIGSADEPGGSLRVLFVDDQGRIGRTRFVAMATTGGAGVQVHVARDGRLLLVWEDVRAVPRESADAGTGLSTLESHIFAARLECP